MGPDLVSASFRRLAAYPAAGVTLWAARDRFGDTCLVVADTYYRTACADAATEAEDGLVVSWSGGPGYPASTTESYTAVGAPGASRRDGRSRDRAAAAAGPAARTAGADRGGARARRCLAAVLGGLAVRALAVPRPPAPVAALPVLRTVAGDVFARRQTATDRRDAPRGGDFVAASVRRSR